MSRKRLLLALVLGIALILLVTGSALAANDSLKFNMELSSSKFTGPTTITVSITVSNAGESDLPGPVTLYYPSGKQVEEFGSPTLTAGSSKNWSGPWSVTQKELDEGKIIFIVRYSAYNDAGELKSYAAELKRTIQYSGAEPELDVKRSIIPQTASDGQEVSVIYEITNNGSADVSSVSIKENASIAKDSASIGSIKAGETAKHVFTVKMGKKDLTSSATVSFKAGGKSYTSKVENATIKYGKINLSATLSADKKGGAPGEAVKLTLKLKNSGSTDFTNVVVTDEKLGTVFENVTVPKGQSLTLEKDLTITETQDLLFTVKGEDGKGQAVETATGQVKVIATDPTQQIVLSVNAEADRDVVYTIPAQVRFTVTVTNNSNVDVSNIAVYAVNTRLYTFASIPAGQSQTFVRDVMISEKGTFQFEARANDQLGQTLNFPSNGIRIDHSAPTPEPTATPVVTPVAPVQITYPPATAEPTWISQAEGIADSLKWILAAVAGALAILLLIGAVRRAISKSQSNKAMDHLDGGLYRDYSATPKRGRRNEIRSGMDEEKPQEEEAEAVKEEATAPAEEKTDIPEEAAPMAETLRRLYSEKKEDAEQAAEAAAETAEEAAAETAEAVTEAAEDAGEALKDAADTTVQAAEAAHRRRAKKN
ncbi:MAG: hypothetical protein IJL36_09615 [Clostridia bacterium]|nr:hypothetical protein [Clostridia bacterium]